MTTLLQTSESRFAVTSRTSLCLREGNPPFGQDRQDNPPALRNSDTVL